MSRRPWTPYPDLDALLEELLESWRRMLGDNLIGAYIQGSFALGAGDQHSDCDWIVALREPATAPQEVALRALHDELPTRTGHWPHDLEGSYAPMAELASVGFLGRRWLFNDHGQRTLEWDDHCNRAYSRWILREHGIVLTGPEPVAFIAPVPDAVLRAEAARAIPTLLDDIATWLDIDELAWGQRYAVTMVCRTLYTLDTARVASKTGALEWAQRTLDPRWRPLLGQVRDDRERGWDPGERPRPGSADAARAFAADAATWAAARVAPSRSG
jgi:aminoglycoside adenylyltransferase-like protein